MSLLGAFKNSFQELVCQRIDEVTLSQARKDPKWQQCVREANDLYHRIEELLGEEHRDIIFEFDNAKIGILACEVEYVYRQGLKDGIALKEELGLNGISNLVC